MHYVIQIIITLIICILFICFSDIFKKLTIPAKLLLLWASISGSMVSFLPFYRHMGQISSYNLKIIAGNSYIYMMLMVLFIFLMNQKQFHYFYKAMIYAAVFSSVYTLFSNQSWCLGLNISTEGTYLAIMLPLICDYFKNKTIPFIPLITVFAIIKTTSSVGLFGGLFAMLLIIEKRYLKYFILVSIPIIIFSYFYVDTGLFSSSGRVAQWKISIDWFFKNANIFTGTGLGTYFGFGPFIQKVYNTHPKAFFPNAHNDWLQILFELGFTGLILAFISFIQLLIASLKINKYIFSAILTFSVASFMNMPLRYSITALAGLMIARIVFELDYNNK